MGYILSDNIHAFPVASRGPGFPYSRITTEYNLTQNLRAFTTMDGFVVKPASSLGDNDIVSFVIHGYYFEATAGDIKAASGIGSNSGTIYASIKVSGDSNEKMELQSMEISAPEYIDDGTDFTGVAFSTLEPGEGVYSIPIVDVTNGSMSIPDGYCYRLSSNDVELIWQDLTPTST